MATSESEVLEETYDLSRSPVFTASDMEKLRNKDKKEGVPLQTPWTFWIDKSRPRSFSFSYMIMDDLASDLKSGKYRLEIPLANSACIGGQRYSTLPRKKKNIPRDSTQIQAQIMATNASSAAQYQANLKKIYSVSTVQDFWAVLKHIPSIDALPPRYSYHLMRDLIQPMWEDELNKYGGTWRLKVAKKDTATVWQELLLAAIGEQLSEGLSEGDSICGVTVAVREKDDLVQVWNVSAKLANNEKMVPVIHALVPNVEFQVVYYKPHQTHAAYESR